VPVHKIPASTYHEDVQAIMREGEIPCSAVKVGRFIIVTTVYHGTRYEFRPAHRLDDLTHAARLGAQEQRVVWERDPLLHSFLTDSIVEDGE
jgi:hypothetical protein